MIRTSKNAQTEALFLGQPARRIDSRVRRRAKSKLNLINQARELRDLRVPFSNNLEALRGDRAGQHSIRVNDQWRVCFIWENGDAYDLEFCDYH